MKAIFLMVSLVVWCAQAEAKQSYNAFNNEWETTSEQATIEYNAYSEVWQFNDMGGVE